MYGCVALRQERQRSAAERSDQPERENDGRDDERHQRDKHQTEEDDARGDRSNRQGRGGRMPSGNRSTEGSFGHFGCLVSHWMGSTQTMTSTISTTARAEASPTCRWAKARR